ncbi:suppressor of lurcher protein 1-like [Cimex lectularius]|uniref:CUB domain-containing protein n=1 Tax=Cimex lectularius TaxID=79782 RepID=A0A8I6THQ3_CIMLE|nr:suppressor of lurcher protein 1-like [Cimex lectularius]
MSNTELISTGNQLYLEFTSSSEWPGHGFTATYHYEELKEKKGDELAKLTDIGPAVSAARSSCDVKISSDSTKKGQLFSPGFPVGYLSGTKCRYEFQAAGKERIKIVFTYFNLFTRNTVKAKECNGEDSVTPYVVIDGRFEKLESYCGNTIPKPIMSNGPRIVLEFNSFNSSKGSGGFRAEYSFVKDFGITTGKQLTDYPCAFRYSSKDGHSGSFHSPNFPGLYPRETECHYFFHRTTAQKTKIYFDFFDIEGVFPCDTGTASDYVEFFNFMDNDKMHTRYCGQLDPFEIEKESRFFRITFRSNDRLDGMGFNASYKFINHPIVHKKIPISFSSAVTPGSFWMLCAFLLLNH